jgi:hypothetical protein
MYRREMIKVRPALVMYVIDHHKSETSTQKFRGAFDSLAQRFFVMFIATPFHIDALALPVL